MHISHSPLHIPYLDLGGAQADSEGAMYEAFYRVWRSGGFILGSELENFESNYAAFSCVSHCIGVANGLDALCLSLRALGIGAGDEVIVPSNTYIASWLAVSQTGARPIPVEPRMETYNIDPSLIAAAITPRTKAIMPVHLYGQACEMDAIMETAKAYRLHVVEDNAQAQGATYHGRITGSFGICNATSFYPTKNLGALGDAGAITTHDIDLCSKLKLLRNYGSCVKYYNEIKGVNSRLDELQAAFLSAKLRLLPKWNADRQNLATLYNALLENVVEIALPKVAAGATHVYHVYMIRTTQRDALKAYLADKGIGTYLHYPVPPHLQIAYSDLGLSSGSLPVAEEISATGLSLPLYPGMTDKQVKSVCNEIGNFFSIG